MADEQSAANQRIRRVNRHLLKSATAKVQKARILRHGVVDEGILQFLLGAYERPAHAEELEPVLSIVGSANLRICFVHADDAVRRARMQARRKVPRAQLGPDYQACWEAAQRANLPLLRTLCGGRFDCVTLEN